MRARIEPIHHTARLHALRRGHHRHTRVPRAPLPIATLPIAMFVFVFFLPLLLLGQRTGAFVTAPAARVLRTVASEDEQR